MWPLPILLFNVYIPHFKSSLSSIIYCNKPTSCMNRLPFHHLHTLYIPHLSLDSPLHQNHGKSIIRAIDGKPNGEINRRVSHPSVLSVCLVQNVTEENTPQVKPDMEATAIVDSSKTTIAPPRTMK
ncbi:hypothetical protein Bca4012_010825 [Brassica carinata]